MKFMICSLRLQKLPWFDHPKDIMQKYRKQREHEVHNMLSSSPKTLPWFDRPKDIMQKI